MARFQRHRKWLAALLSVGAGLSFQVGGCALGARLAEQRVTPQEVYDDLLWTAFWGPIRNLRGSTDD